MGMLISTSGGMPHTPSGGGNIAPPIAPWPSVRMSTKTLRSRLSAIARRRSALSKGGLSRLTIIVRLPLSSTSSQIACGTWLLTSFNSGIDTPERECHVEIAGGECQHLRRRIGYDRIFDAVEVRAVRFPVIPVARHFDGFVRLERTGADRMLPHLSGRHVAWVNR